jgi:uncharacterized RDD family membrane protein YckC
MSVLRSVQLRLLEGWQQRSGNRVPQSAKPGIWRRGLASCIDRIVPLPFLILVFPEWIGAVVLYHLLADAVVERRSLGKWLCRLRVVSVRTGEKCSWWQAALRRTGFMVAQAGWCLTWSHPEWLPFVLAYELFSLACMAIHPQGRRPEDFLAGTQVVTERAYRRARS